MSIRAAAEASVESYFRQTGQVKVSAQFGMLMCQLRAALSEPDPMTEAVSLVGEMLEYVERAYDYSFPDGEKNYRIAKEARDFLKRMEGRT